MIGGHGGKDRSQQMEHPKEYPIVDPWGIFY